MFQDTGHAVFLPKSGGNALNSNDGQKKKKKGKKWFPCLL